MTILACPRCGYVGEPSRGFCPQCIPGAEIEMLNVDALRDEAEEMRKRGLLFIAMRYDAFADRLIGEGEEKMNDRDQTQITFSCENCGEELTVSVQMAASFDALGLALENARAVAAARAQGWEILMDGLILCPSCVSQLVPEERSR